MDFNRRISNLIEGLGSSLRRELTRAAEQTSYSRSQYYRRFKGTFKETPGGMATRLLMERAGELLQHTEMPLWQISLATGFSDQAAFNRCFRRHYKVAPSRFRALRGADCFLRSNSEIHYWRGTILQRLPQGEKQMDLVQVMVKSDLTDTRRLIEAAFALPEEKLESPLDCPMNLEFFHSPERTVKDVVDRMIYTKEVWLAAIYGRGCPPDGDRSPASLRVRLDSSEQEFAKLVGELTEENRWSDQFIDALCEPPATFTFAGTVAHILSYNCVRRTQLRNALIKLGVEDLGHGDPIDVTR